MFGWLKRTGPDADDMRRAEDAIRVLSEQMADLQSAHRRMRAEWEDMFERLVRRDDRLRKRQERETEATPAPDTIPARKLRLRLRLREQNGTPGTVR